MAQRRMFSLKVIDTDMFLEMPQSTRLLYYELSMRADDDGFVSSPKKILKMVGCSEDDFKILIAKQYIIPFESGICVIKHWRVHNYIRGDRYQETDYKQEKSMLTEDDGKYEIENVIPVVIPHVIPTVSTGKVRLGKDRLELGKVSKDKNTYAEFVAMTTDEHQKLTEQYGEQATNRFIEILNLYKGSTGKKYKSDYLTILNWVVDRYKEEQTKKQTSKKQSGNIFMDIAREEGYID